MHDFQEIQEWGAGMSNSIQDNTGYVEGVPTWSGTDAGLAVTPVDVAFDVLPVVMVNEQLMSSVVSDLVQDIAEDETAAQQQPLSEDEQILQQLLNMSREWVAMSVMQQVYESNMRVLRSISGVKSEANHFLKRSDDYVTNPFISLSLIDQMDSGYTSGNDFPPNCTVDTTPEAGQNNAGTEQDTYDQLLQTLTRQWLDLQDGQTVWQGFSNGLDTLVYNNALTNNRLENQNTSMAAQMNGADLQSILTTLQNLL
jgi:hypothetical protein